MKKLIIVLIVTLTLCLNSVFANTSKVNNSYFKDEVFNAILFDYKYLTKNDDETCKLYFDKLKNGTENENKEKITVMTEREIKNEIIRLQEDYENIKDYENKEDLDLYILELALKYYNFEENKESILKKQELRNKINEIKVQKQNESELNTRNLNGEDVARLWICADPNTTNVPSSGYTGIETIYGHHSWLAVKNLTLSSMTVGGLQINSTKRCSIGTWKTPVHYGIFYNLEKYYEDEMSDECVSVSTYIDATTLSIINYAFTDSDYDKWSVWYNCTDFAIEIWNYAVESDYQISAGIINTPIGLKNSILNLGGSNTLVLSDIASVYYGGANPIYCNPALDF